MITYGCGSCPPREATWRQRPPRPVKKPSFRFGVTDYVISSTGSPDTVKDESGLWTVMPFMNSGSAALALDSGLCPFSFSGSGQPRAFWGNACLRTKLQKGHLPVVWLVHRVFFAVWFALSLTLSLSFWCRLQREEPLNMPMVGKKPRPE